MNIYYSFAARLSLCLVCLFAIAGCGDLLSKPDPLQAIVLHNLDLEGPLCSSAVPVQVIVNLPETYGGLNTDRIATLLDGREIQYMRQYKWESPAPVIVHRMLIETMNKSQCFAGAGGTYTGITSPYRLLTDIKRMHYLHDSKSKEGEVSVHLLITLLDMDTGIIIAQHDATGSKRGNFEDTIVFSEALEVTLNSVIRESVEWSAKTLSSYITAKSPH